jgi:hypothetical protein
LFLSLFLQYFEFSIKEEMRIRFPLLQRERPVREGHGNSGTRIVELEITI